MVRNPCVFNILTWKCASRYNGVHFFDIRTSKSGANMWCFVHFDLQNVLRATTACTFSTSRTSKSGREHCGVLYILTSKCASRHNGVHFFDTFSTSELPKVVRHCQVFCTLLTWKCASRNNGVHFFDISTSKSGPTLVCFVHFDFKMCFAPQRRALFRHLNFQKWSES